MRATLIAVLLVGLTAFAAGCGSSSTTAVVRTDTEPAYLLSPAGAVAVGGGFVDSRCLHTVIVALRHQLRERGVSAARRREARRTLQLFEKVAHGERGSVNASCSQPDG